MRLDPLPHSFVETDRTGDEGGRRVRRRAAGALAGVLVLLALVPGVALASTDDPYRDQQWALDVLGADEAWQVTRGRGAVVAVIDTGVDLQHPDLRSRLARDADGEVVGLDLVDGDGAPQDEHGHGTLVAGIIAASAGNGEGIAGVAPEATILPIRVLDAEGSGRREDVGQAIRWAVDRGADVINLSLESAPGGLGSGVPLEAIQHAWDRGVVVVAASGNTEGAEPPYPAETPVLLVGAVDEADQAAPFAQVGRPDGVVAPGVGIVSTWCRPPGGDACDGTPSYGMADGTSFAAPHVAGVAALLVAQGLDHEQVVERIRSTAVDLDDRHGAGAGRVDAAAAVVATSPSPRASAPVTPESVEAADHDTSPPLEPDPEPRTEPGTGSAPPATPEVTVEPAPEPRPAPPPQEPATETAAPGPPPQETAPPDPEVAPLEDLEALAPVGVAASVGPAGERLLWQLVALVLVVTTASCWLAVARSEHGSSPGR